MTCHTAAGPRLHVRTEAGARDVARALGDERCATVKGFLAAGEAVRARARELDGDDAAEYALAPAVPDPGKIVCLGRNYQSHASEMGHEAPRWPEVFLRLPHTLVPPFGQVRLPSVSQRADYEGELAVVVGRGGRHIAADRAFEAVAGYCVANDVTMRDWQHRGRQWTPGKNFEATLPLGPELVTTDEVDARDLVLETRVNGEIMQSARTSQMIFDIPRQIEFVSSWLTLEPGDVILTGTPGGVGVARTPPRFLELGDVVEVSVEGVGTIRNRIVGDGLEPATPHWSALASEASSVERGKR